MFERERGGGGEIIKFIDFAISDRSFRGARRLASGLCARSAQRARAHGVAQRRCPPQGLDLRLVPIYYRER